MRRNDREIIELLPNGDPFGSGFIEACGGFFDREPVSA